MTLTEYLAQPGNSQTKLAAAVGVSQSAVSQWVNGGMISPHRVRVIVQATNGLVTAHDLAPDLYPAGFVFPADGPQVEAAA